MDQELKDYLEGKFAQVDGRFAQMDGRFAQVDGKLGDLDHKFADLDHKFVDLENRLVEKMRDMQTELLRGFESFSAGQTIRLRKVEADQSNLDVSLRGRLDVVESRLMQIELRLGKTGLAN